MEQIQILAQFSYLLTIPRISPPPKLLQILFYVYFRIRVATFYCPTFKQLAVNKYYKQQLLTQIYISIQRAVIALGITTINCTTSNYLQHKKSILK